MNHMFLLDTVSRMKGSKLVFGMYCKPTDKHQYLLPSSCHPEHCCKNIPYSLALRIRRICTQEETFDKRSRELSQHLQNRGYSNTNIEKAVSRAREQKRVELLEHKTRLVENTRTPFTVTYHPDLPSIHGILDKHWASIEASSK